MRTILIEEITSQGIQLEMKSCGVTEAQLLNEVYLNSGEWIRFFEFETPVGVCKVAETNGDPVWQENEPQEFQALMEECGVDF